MSRPVCKDVTKFTRRGSIVILVMIFLALFASLSVAFAAATNMNLRLAGNYSTIQNSQLATESGLDFTLAVVASLAIKGEDAEQDLMLALANQFAAAMDGTMNVGSGEITFDGQTIDIPDIKLNADGRSFSGSISPGPDGLPRLTIAGNADGITRRIQMTLRPVALPSRVFDYGIASKGKILVGGDGTVSGANLRSEADVLSATYSSSAAIEISGSCNIEGDLFTSNPDSYVKITGNPTVAGVTKQGDIQNHIHIGVGNVAFPQIDTTIYEPYVQNIIDSSTNFSSNLVLENVRIKAGTNPSFSGNVSILGVVYIEQPNSVKFTGGANITGVIVTADAGPNGHLTNKLEFSGNMSMRGVEELPNEPQFDGLRNLEGTAILAPGFAVEMTGSFDTISGAVAADKFTITGNTSGTISGPVICYGDTEFTLWGSSHLNIDRSRYSNVLPGFKNPVHLLPDADSYTELK